MRQVAIIFCAALLVGLPTISHAQYNDNDQQDPKEYHDEDSQPLALFADLIYPIGYALEWVVARPLHYLSHDSAVAPVYRPVGGSDMAPPPPVPIIPDNTMDDTTASNVPQDWSPTRGGPIQTNTTVIRRSTTTTTTTVAPSYAAPSSAPAANQPALH
jgi:hypothetical protein